MPDRSHHQPLFAARILVPLLVKKLKVGDGPGRKQIVPTTRVVNRDANLVAVEDQVLFLAQAVEGGEERDALDLERPAAGFESGGWARSPTLAGEPEFQVAAAQ